MPTIRKLDSKEISAHKTAELSQQQQTDSRYDALLANLVPGDWNEVEPKAGDGRLKVRNRLVSAAKRRGWYLAFRCSSGNSVRFEIKAMRSSEAEDSEVEPEPTKN